MLRVASHLFEITSALYLQTRSSTIVIGLAWTGNGLELPHWFLVSCEMVACVRLYRLDVLSMFP